jgi:hypothetical protein
MSYLGFQTVYRLLNQLDAVVCERVFLPEDPSRTSGLVSLESGRRLGDFDVIAFSISFENDFPNLLKILEMAALPLKSADRGHPHPLVMPGSGRFSNPEPLAEFIDFFILENRNHLTQLVDRLVGRRPDDLLKELAPK